MFIQAITLQMPSLTPSDTPALPRPGAIAAPLKARSIFKPGKDAEKVTVQTPRGEITIRLNSPAPYENHRSALLAPPDTYRQLLEPDGQTSLFLPSHSQVLYTIYAKDEPTPDENGVNLMWAMFWVPEPYLSSPDIPSSSEAPLEPVALLKFFTIPTDSTEFTDISSATWRVNTKKLASLGRTPADGVAPDVPFTFSEVPESTSRLLPLSKKTSQGVFPTLSTHSAQSYRPPPRHRCPNSQRDYRHSPLSECPDSQSSYRPPPLPKNPSADIPIISTNNMGKTNAARKIENTKTKTAPKVENTKTHAAPKVDTKAKVAPKVENTKTNQAPKMDNTKTDAAPNPKTQAEDIFLKMCVAHRHLRALIASDPMDSVYTKMKPAKQQPAWLNILGFAKAELRKDEVATFNVASHYFALGYWIERYNTCGKILQSLGELEGRVQGDKEFPHIGPLC
jgi:hypothetical protein